MEFTEHELTLIVLCLEIGRKAFADDAIAAQAINQQGLAAQFQRQIGDALRLADRFNLAEAY